MYHKVPLTVRAIHSSSLVAVTSSGRCAPHPARSRLWGVPPSCPRVVGPCEHPSRRGVACTGVYLPSVLTSALLEPADTQNLGRGFIAHKSPSPARRCQHETNATCLSVSSHESSISPSPSIPFATLGAIYLVLVTLVSTTIQKRMQLLARCSRDSLPATRTQRDIHYHPLVCSSDHERAVYYR